MRGVYTASYKITGLTGNKTLMYLTAPSDQSVELLRASVTNLSNETNEQFECKLQRITTLGTPTATAVTPAKHEDGGQAASSTVKADVTASPPTYPADNVDEFGREGVSSLAGWVWPPTPEERVTVKGGGSIGIKMPSTITAIDAIVTLTFREIG